ncbi:MAG TPA: acyltransferase [Humisphaera sp.]|jgi:peptidoglycan/LPS O-acetylase OafA/YrhL|nr:acyltransferase [Humisphaera sp.]
MTVLTPSISHSPAPGQVGGDNVRAPRATYQTLDAWRGVAALWVVGIHAAAVLVNQNPALAHSPLIYLCLHGGLGVQLFFVISGYCIAGAAASTLGRGRGSRSFLLARFRRIYPTCWLALILYILTVVFIRFLLAHHILKSSSSGQMDLGQNGLAFWASNFTLTQLFVGQSCLVVVTWSLCYEMVFYVIIAALIGVRRQIGQLTGLLMATHLATILILVMLIRAPAKMSYPLDLFPQFGLGVLVYDLLRRPPSRALKLTAAAVGAFMLAFIAAHNRPIGYMEQSSRGSFAICLLFAASLLWLAPHDRTLARLAPVRVLGLIGLFSYSLYLTHYISVAITNQIFHKLNPGGGAYVQLAATFALAVATAALFYLVAERPFISSRQRAVLTAK